jgi:hypothetical protein
MLPRLLVSAPDATGDALGVIEIDYRNARPPRHRAKLYQTQADVTERALFND